MSELFSAGTSDRAVFTGGAALILAMLALPVSGCQPEDFSFQAADMTFTAEEMEAVALPSEIEAPPLQAGQLASSQGRLIRSGSARVEVSDLESAVSEVRRIGESLSNWAQSSPSHGRVLPVPFASLTSLKHGGSGGSEQCRGPWTEVDYDLDVGTPMAR